MLRLLLLVSLAAAVGACGDAAPPTDGDAPAYAAEATSAAEVAARMMTRWEQRFADVDSFTVEASGLAVTYRATSDSLRAAGDGLDWFQIQGSKADSVELDRNAAELIEQQVPNVPRIAKGFAGATFGGVSTLGGRRGYVLSSEDPGALIGSPGNASPDESLDQTMRIFIDADTYDILEVLTTVRVDSLERPLTQRLVYEDFRSEGGLPLPYTIRRVEEGMDQYVDETQRMMEGGRLGMQRQRVESEPPSPERTAALAEIDAELAVLDGQPRTAKLTVEKVTVLGRR